MVTETELYTLKMEITKKIICLTKSHLDSADFGLLLGKEPEIKKKYPKEIILTLSLSHAIDKIMLQKENKIRIIACIIEMQELKKMINARNKTDLGILKDIKIVYKIPTLSWKSHGNISDEMIHEMLHRGMNAHSNILESFFPNRKEISDYLKEKLTPDKAF